MSDFSWRGDGMFFTILANNDQAAENLSRAMDLNGGSNVFGRADFELFRRLAKAGGYSFRRLAKVSRPAMSDDALLAALMA